MVHRQQIKTTSEPLHQQCQQDILHFDVDARTHIAVGNYPHQHFLKLLFNIILAIYFKNIKFFSPFAKKHLFLLKVFHKWHFSGSAFVYSTTTTLCGGAVASWLVRSTPVRVVRIRALAGVIVLCS